MSIVFRKSYRKDTANVPQSQDWAKMQGPETLQNKDFRAAQFISICGHYSHLMRNFMASTSLLRKNDACHSDYFD